MTNATFFFLVIAVITLVFLFNLVRSRRLREKYVALWMVVGLVVIALSLFPTLLGRVAQLVGVAVPSNLLFFLAIMLLLGVCLQLSLEISRVEEKSRTLAEHVAILNLQLLELNRQALPASSVDAEPTVVLDPVSAPEPQPDQQAH